MLSSIEICNFKSARDLLHPIPLRNLTILSGLNGSGKSTVLQAIALLRQSLELINNQSTDLKNLHLHGPLVQLGQVSDVLNERATEDWISFTLSNQNQHWKFKAETSNKTATSSVITGKVTPNSDHSCALFLQECEFQFLQADRLTPRTHYERSSKQQTRSFFLGTKGQYTPDFLAAYGDTLDVRVNRHCPNVAPRVDNNLLSRIAATPKLYDQIGGWLQHLSPGIKLSAELIRQTDLVTLGFSYASNEIGQDSNRRRPTNVGFGLTYVLPIVTACLSANPGALLLLENPEAHLHPQGQAALGLLIAKCAADGVQILLETHSDHVLNGIRLAVKHGSILHNDVSLCHFERDTKTGDSYIQSPIILPNGDLSSWPEGFFDEWEKSLEALLE